MSAAFDPPEVTAWVDAAHARYAGSLLDVMGDAVELIGLGGPDAAAADLGRSLDLAPVGDLRRLLLDRPADCVLVAVRGGIGPEFLAAAAEQGTRVVTTEPPAGSLQELDAPGLRAAAPCVVEVPRFDRGPGVEAALDPLSAVGAPVQARMISHGRPDEGSLFARLLDAWRTALRFVELPENLLAAWSPPPGGAPERLRDAGGRVAALARCRGGGTVSLDVAADAARSRRSLRLLGSEAQVEVDETGHVRLPLDEAAPDEAEPLPGAGVSFVDQVAARWRRHLHHPEEPVPGLSHDAEALACVEAMRLSARTGEPESPGRLLRLRGRG